MFTKLLKYTILFTLYDCNELNEIQIGIALVLINVFYFMLKRFSCKIHHISDKTPECMLSVHLQSSYPPTFIHFQCVGRETHHT